MWPSFRLTVTAALIVVASFLLVALAATLALVRAQVEAVDADLASVIRADYSADPRGTKLAPLTEGIVAVARADEGRLRETASGVEIVPVFHQPHASVAEQGGDAATPSTPAADPGQAPPTSQPTPGYSTPHPGMSPTHTPSGPQPSQTPGTLPPKSPIPTAKPTPEPTSQPTPGPGPSVTSTPATTRTPTPVPTASPTGTPSRTPTTTPSPAPTPAPTALPTLTPTVPPSPTATPSPTLTPTPTPTPLPTQVILYLHNNPTPPTGDTPAHDLLVMDYDLPTAPDPSDPFDFYNYDADRNDSPGLTIVRGGSGPNEGDAARHQHWQTPALPAAVTMQGQATVKLWSATKDFDTTKGGAVSAYLRDCDGSSCVELGGGTVSDSTWQQGSATWVLKTFTFPVGTYTAGAGNVLELVVVVGASSTDDMWFAYDTNDRKSRVTLSTSGAALP